LIGGGSNDTSRLVVVASVLPVKTKGLFGAPQEVSDLLLGEAPLASDQVTGEQAFLSPTGNGRDAYTEAVGQIGLGAELASTRCWIGKIGDRG
jgi:hypothetical protein